MKILFVITKAEVGGAQMSVLNLARELKARGHKITVGFGDGDFLPSELDKAQITHVRFRNLKRTHNPLANIFFIAEIKKFLQNTPPPSEGAPLLPEEGLGVVGVGGSAKEGVGMDRFDVVHFNSSNSLFGAIGVKLASRKIKTVFTFRGMSMLDEHYKKGGLLKIVYFWLFKFLAFFVDRPVFVSRENLEKFGQGRLVKNGILVYNGLDPRRLEFLLKTEAKAELAEKTGIDLTEKYIIGSIGRTEYAKNYEFLINVMPAILEIKPEAVAVIIGGGPEEENLRALIKEKGLEDRIFLLGNIPHASRFIKGFDLFVLPSRYEGLSITLIEALFAGARILTTRVGGNPETVGCEEEIFELNDQVDFLVKFKKLQDFETQLGVDSNNQKQAQNFILAKTADGYEKAYK